MSNSKSDYLGHQKIEQSHSYINTDVPLRLVAGGLSGRYVASTALKKGENKMSSFSWLTGWGKAL